MHTHNVNVKTATEESSGKMGVKYPSPLLILIAEGEKNSQEEWDVMEFGSLAALKDFHHVPVVAAEHFKKFVRRIGRMGITI
ncbi:hypothetical protein DFO53_4572 [Enterobacter sp. AG5470]|nr:hypothetical protein DFO53_4572 [Enterobacter sp. AG5470]